jgi:hypothetical protein
VSIFISNILTLARRRHEQGRRTWRDRSYNPSSVKAATKSIARVPFRTSHELENSKANYSPEEEGAGGGGGGGGGG